MSGLGDGPPLAKVRWKRAHRIVKSVWPPIDLFERVAEPADWDALMALEGLSNPRLRQEVGEISLVPPERRVAGPGASVVMAAFTHPAPLGSRFSDGRFGVYYAAESLETAVAETAYHLGRFYGDSREEAGLLADMRVYVGGVEGALHDIRAGFAALHDPDSYAASKAFAHALRASGSDGLIFRSVRREGGECIAAFWPDVVTIPQPTRHLAYHWDGARIDRYFDHTTAQWRDVPR